MSKLNFDEALKQLEQVVKQLEMGDLPLEKSIELYKQGMTLSGVCHEKLQKIETEVAKLVDSANKVTDFDMVEE